MTIKEQIIEGLRGNGFDYFTAAEIATDTIREFLASGKEEQTYWLVNGHFQITLRRKPDVLSAENESK